MALLMETFRKLEIKASFLHFKEDIYKKPTITSVPNIESCQHCFSARNKIKMLVITTFIHHCPGGLS